MSLVFLCGSCETYLIMQEPHNVAAERSCAARHGWDGIGGIALFWQCYACVRCVRWVRVSPSSTDDSEEKSAP
jgi:hypothetical protein